MKKNQIFDPNFKMHSNFSLLVKIFNKEREFKSNMTEEIKNDDEKNVNSSDAYSDDTENPTAESEEQTEKPQIIFALSKDVQDYVETELGLVKFLDFLIEQKFDIAFNKIDMYQDRFFDIFIKENDRLSDEFDRLEIEDAVNTIKDTTEEIALENGIKNSLQKRMNKINYILMGGLFGILILFQISGLSQNMNYLMIPLLIVVLCFVPQIIRKKMTNSWNDFKTTFNDELESRIGDKIGNIKLFNKFALNDCRDFMLENKFPLQLLKFDLYSMDYMGVKVISEKIQSGRKVYFLQFEYPEGIEPFPTPTKVLQSGTATMKRTSQIEDGEDLFVIFPNAIFSEDKLMLDNQQIAENFQQKEIETLLDSSEFEKVSDPENIIENFGINQKILCECDNPLKLNDMQKITTEIGFEFYLGIASKCSGCGKNPFVLFSKEGNEIPDDLQGIF